MKRITAVLVFLCLSQASLAERSYTTGSMIIINKTNSGILVECGGDFARIYSPIFKGETGDFNWRSKKSDKSGSCPYGSLHVIVKDLNKQYMLMLYTGGLPAKSNIQVTLGSVDVPNERPIWCIDENGTSNYNKPFNILSCAEARKAVNR